MDLYTCGCGFRTRICRNEVTPEEWETFLAYHRMAFAWAVDHLHEDDGGAEEFAERFAGEYWDDPEPPAFPTVLAAERRERQRAAEAENVRQRAAQRVEARARDAKARAARRRAALTTERIDR